MNKHNIIVLFTHRPPFSSVNQRVWNSSIEIRAILKHHAVIADRTSHQLLSSWTRITILVKSCRPYAEGEPIVAVLGAS